MYSDVLVSSRKGKAGPSVRNCPSDNGLRAFGRFRVSLPIPLPCPSPVWLVFSILYLYYIKYLKYKILKTNQRGQPT
jgi:hypothetical protein